MILHLRDRTALLPGVLCLLVAIAAFSFACSQYIDASRFIRTSVTTPGVVVATPNGGWHPEILVTLPDGSTVHDHQNGFFLRWYRVGDALTMRYANDDQRPRFRISSFGGDWGGALATALFGAGWLLISVLALIQATTGNRLLEFQGFARRS